MDNEKFKKIQRDIRKSETLEGMSKAFKNHFLQEFIITLQSALAVWFVGTSSFFEDYVIEEIESCHNKIGKVTILEQKLLEWTFILEKIIIDKFNEFLGSEDFFEMLEKCKKR